MHRIAYTPDTPVASPCSNIEALSPDTAWLAVASPNAHAVDIFKTVGKVWRFWNSYDGHRDGIMNRQGTITALTWLPDSYSLVSASSTGSIHLWKRTGIHHRTLKHAQAEKRAVKALSWHESDGLHIVYEDGGEEQMAHVTC